MSSGLLLLEKGRICTWRMVASPPWARGVRTGGWRTQKDHSLGGFWAWEGLSCWEKAVEHVGASATACRVTGQRADDQGSLVLGPSFQPYFSAIFPRFLPRALPFWMDYFSIIVECKIYAMFGVCRVEGEAFPSGTENKTFAVPKLRLPFAWVLRHNKEKVTVSVEKDIGIRLQSFPICIFCL